VDKRAYIRRPRFGKREKWRLGRQVATETTKMAAAGQDSKNPSELRADLWFLAGLPDV
jgi:hypothetical protein